MELIEIPSGEDHIKAIVSKGKSPTIATIILAHGAGAPMTHSFLEQLSIALNELNIDVIRFNFPYIDSGRKSPGSPKPNIEAWGNVIDWVGSNYESPIFASGKSYGGRMASHYLANGNDKVSGLIYFGFPLHAPGRDSIDRANHLAEISVPQLFIQGTKDALAKVDLIQMVVDKLVVVDLTWIENGDHSFKVKGRKQLEVIDEIASISSDWIIKSLAAK